MNAHYKYRCFNCKTEFASDEIESDLIYLCPHCGSTKKNKPLEGVLEIIYDYDLIKSKTPKEAFLCNKVGRFWEYPYLWPLNFDKNVINNIQNFQLEKLNLTSCSIYDIEVNGKTVKLFDDTRNPTLSYKDRASILVALKAIQLGISEISAASTGNAGSSLAGICARLGIKSHIFVPKNIPSGKRIQIQSFGASIYIVDGDYDQAFDLCFEVSKSKKWYNRNTAYNPLTIEGKKSAVYDMFLLLNGNLPNNIIVPVGDGVIISGIYKGLVELLKLGWIEKLPKLIAVQAEGSSALCKYLGKGKYEYKPAVTVADSISAGAPRNLYMAAEAVKGTDGKCVTVSDEEIISAQKILSRKFGILAEPAAVASFAGLIKTRTLDSNAYKDSILMITGNGLKDISALESWNEVPDIKTSDEWKSDLI